MSEAHREIKSNLFVSYFSDSERAIDLYNAIAGENYPPTAEVEFTIIENVLFKERLNDIAFIIEGRLVVLVEHMSYISSSLPLWFLQYINEILKGYQPKKSFYDSKQKPIPTPEFFVIYNGKGKHPEKKVLRLSDAYIEKQEAPCLDLTVPVYNIAEGFNEGLLAQSKSLLHYATLIRHVWKYQQAGYSAEKAISTAIHDCLENGIMVEYLEKNNAEVRRMLSYEWDEELYREALLEEGEEKGLIKGREEGLMAVARNMKADGDPPEKIARNTGLSEEAIAAL